MGFKPQATVYNLNFEDTNLDGLQVKMKGLTIGEFEQMLAQAGFAGTAEETKANNRKMAELFLKKLISWNLEDDNGPVPQTISALYLQEQPLVNAIITAWQVAMLTVPDPLGKASKNGSSSEEASLGLGGSSQSLPNWPEPNS